MTRYITRSKYTEDSSVKSIYDTFKKYEITSYENCAYELRKLTDTYFNTNQLVDFIEKFYDYREFLSYNSHVYVIEISVPNYIYDLKNMTINGKHLYNVNPIDSYTNVPLVVMLSNDDSIMPIPVSTIFDNHDDYYNYYKYGSYIYCGSKQKIFKYRISTHDIGTSLFYCDYMFDDVDNVICNHSHVKSLNGTRYVNNDIIIPSELIDFISADRPSLEHYAIDHHKFNDYKLPKFIEYINSNINSIVSENSPPELVKIFNELTLHEEFEPKYITCTV